VQLGAGRDAWEGPGACDCSACQAVCLRPSPLATAAHGADAVIDLIRSTRLLSSI
jgi:hypothetical protein